jgi:hypothetical protein
LRAKLPPEFVSYVVFSAVWAIIGDTAKKRLKTDAREKQNLRFSIDSIQ